MTGSGAAEAYLGAIVAAALGMVLLAVGWWGSRPKDRRRCPKCWYDMRRIESLVCSECGLNDGVARPCIFPQKRTVGWCDTQCPTVIQ